LARAGGADSADDTSGSTEGCDDVDDLDDDDDDDVTTELTNERREAGRHLDDVITELTNERRGSSHYHTPRPQQPQGDPDRRRSGSISEVDRQANVTHSAAFIFCCTVC